MLNLAHMFLGHDFQGWGSVPVLRLNQEQADGRGKPPYSGKRNLSWHDSRVRGKYRGGYAD